MLLCLCHPACNLLLSASQRVWLKVYPPPQLGFPIPPDFRISIFAELWQHFYKISGASHISKPKSATKDQGLLGNISLYQTFIWGLNPATVNETTPHPNVTQWLLLWMFLFYISRHWRWKWQRNLRDNCWLTRLNVVVASDGFLMASRCLGDDHFMMGVISSSEGRRIDSFGGNPTQ